MSEIKLYNDDALKILKTIPNESIDMVFSDIPYLVTSRGNSGTMGGYWKSEIAKSGTIFENNTVKPKDFMTDLYRIMKDKTICLLMINHVNLIELLNEGEKVGFHFVKCLIWEKGNKICGRYGMGCFEYIVLFRKGGDRPFNECGTPDILHIPINKLKDENGNNLHDTEKPIELAEILIRNCSNEGETVLDMFMGIGSCGIASKKLNRNFIGCEIDKKYFDIAEQRINGTFGKINVDDEIFGL